jgi:predicted nucleotidyltransferase
MSHHINLIRIKGVHHALLPLNEKIVFVGGATVSLYADKPEQADVRPTNDIDVLVEVGSYAGYVKIQQQLAALGFEIDRISNVTCRYLYEGLVVDVMPTDENALGFSNRWYRDGFANLTQYSLDTNTNVNIFTSPYFLASKMEAFIGHGKNDGRTSRDFEDIVFLLDNRSTIWKELQQTTNDLRIFLQDEIRVLLANKNIEEWISAHLEYETAAARGRMILNNMKTFVSAVQ